MSKDIKDYLPFYLGCEVLIHPQEPDKRVGTFIGFTDEHRLSARVKFRTGPDGQINLLFLKPILYPLITIPGDVTSNLVLPLQYAIDSFDAPGLNEKKITQCAILVNALRKLSYDCDGLIESGLAIDKTKLDNPIPLNPIKH